MKIRRKDGAKPKKDDTKRIDKSDISQADAVNEDYTDINESSAPSDNNNPKTHKIEEIYSTHDKQVKYKRLTPIEAEQAAKRMQIAKQKLTSGKGEISLEKPTDQQQNVQLVSEYEEGTVISDDIIADIDELSSPDKVQIIDVDGIDIDLDSSAALKKYEHTVSDRDRYDERHTKKPINEIDAVINRSRQNKSVSQQVTRIPVYQHVSRINTVHLKAGRFTEVVMREYDEYLKSNDPTISKRPSHIADRIDPKQSLLFTLSQRAQQLANAHKGEKPQPQKDSSDDNIKNEAKNNQPKKRVGKIRKFFRILGALIFPSFVSGKAEGGSGKNSTIDYQSRQDYKQIMTDIRQNVKRLAVRTGVLGVLLGVVVTLSVIEKVSGKGLFGSSAYASIIYVAVNLAVLIISGFVSKRIISNGLKPMKALRGNSDTAVSVAFVICAVQSVVAMFFSDRFTGADMHLYVSVVVLGLMLNTLGRLIMTMRVRDNFKFFSAKSPTYAAKIYKDEDTARKMLSGTAASRSVVAYQHPTDFLSDFLKISYAPDPSEEIAGKLAPITSICALFVAVIYGVVFKSAVGALSAMAVMCCIGIPVCSLLSGNIPLRIFCKNTLANSAMVSGYPSVRQFCDSSALIAGASQLYPKTSVRLDKIISHTELRFDDYMQYASVVLKEADSPLYGVVEGYTRENEHNLPQVESVMYEDKLGLVGWIAGERVLIGSRSLLDRYHIMLRDAEDETKYKKQGKCVTYIACSGQLVATIITTYKPDPKVSRWLSNAEDNGLCIIVSTTDNNVTAEKIAEDYRVFYRTVKVLSTGYANTCREVCAQKEETSRAYLATRGGIASLLCAVSGSVRLKSNLIIGMIVQIFGLVLGVLLCATIALYATVAMLGSVEILLYILFWGCATIAAELVMK